MNRTARSIEELFPIIAYARAGDLKNVKAWIDAGSPLNLPPGKKTKRQSPLQIAIEKGFLTLTEILLDGGADPVSDTALRCAVNNGRTDIVTLLLDRGAKLDDISFEEVCHSRNIDLVKLFLDRGADPIAGAPFYGALMCGLNPLLGFFKELLSKNPGLQPQADATLAYYASKGNPRGVGLMIWAGANPTTDIQLECEHEGQTALEVAANSGSVPTLKTMKPERFPAVLPKLMSAVAYHSSKEMREYLLSIGAPLNDAEDGSCSMLRSALYSIEWDSNSRFGGFSSPSKVDEHIANIDTLLGRGAKFPEMDAGSLRRIIRTMSADPLIRLLKVLRSRAAIPEEVLFAAVSTPKMREVLASRHEEAVAVIRQIPPKATPPKAAAKITPPPSVAEIRERAEASLISLVRNNAPSHFLEGRIWRHWTLGEFRRRLKMPPEDKRDPVVFLREACEAVQDRTKLATISLSSNTGYSFPTIEIKLHPEATWNEVVREICKLAQSEPLPLTTAGQALLDMIEGGSTDWTDRNTVAKRMGKARYTRFEPFVCAELACKRGIKVTFEERKKDGAPHDMEVKFSIAARGTAEAPVLTNVIHWSWKGSLDFQSKANRDLFRRSIVDHITSTQPSGSEPKYLFKVHTVAGLAAVFVKAELSRYYLSRQLAELFSELSLPDGITVAFDFSENSSEWWAALVPTVSWENGLKSITAEKERPSLEQRFGLKHDAARLLEWIESLKPESMLGTWTPSVEPAIEREIGFLTEWPKDNIPALLQMLVDEINEKTAYSLSLQPWRAAGELQTRIKVSKETEAERPIDEAVAALARKRGIKVSEETMKAIAGLLGQGSATK